MSTANSAPPIPKSTSQALPTARQTKHPEEYPGAGKLSWCVLCRSELRAPSLVRGLPWPLHWGSRRMPLAYGLVVELHTFLHRMAIRCRRRHGVFWLSVSSFRRAEGPPIGPLHPEENTRKCACIYDIESFVERHPWATILDLETYRDAWQAGAEWAERNVGKPDHTQASSKQAGSNQHMICESSLNRS